METAIAILIPLLIVSIVITFHYYFWSAYRLLLEKKTLKSIQMPVSRSNFLLKIRNICGDNEDSLKYYFKLVETDINKIELRFNHEIPRKIFNMNDIKNFCPQHMPGIIDTNVAITNVDMLTDFYMEIVKEPILDDFKAWDFYSFLYDYKYFVTINEVENGILLEIIRNGHEESGFRQFHRLYRLHPGWHPKVRGGNLEASRKTFVLFLLVYLLVAPIATAYLLYTYEVHRLDPKDWIIYLLSLVVIAGPIVIFLIIKNSILINRYKKLLDQIFIKLIQGLQY